MHSTPHHSSKMHHAKLSGWKKVLIGLIALVVIAEWAFVINGPVGDPTIVEGSITQRCVPRGKQNNIFHCTAQLRDGSSQLFIALHPVEPGAPVSFLRYNRRFLGVSYETKSY